MTRLKPNGSRDIRWVKLLHGGGGVGITEIADPPFRASVPYSCRTGRPCRGMNVDDDTMAGARKCLLCPLHATRPNAGGIMSRLQQYSGLRWFRADSI